MKIGATSKCGLGSSVKKGTTPQAPFEILGATYGNKDVTKHIKAMYKQGIRKFQALNSVLGDLWPGHVKVLKITYMYHHNVIHRSVTEPSGGGTITLPNDGKSQKKSSQKKKSRSRKGK